MSIAQKNIVHFVAKTKQKVSHILTENFKLDRSHQELLFALGAIYLNKKRLLIDEVVKPHDHLQIYLRPKRYSVTNIDWKTRIVFETSQFCVINKPAGLPVHATEDNLTENVLCQLKEQLNIPLWSTQRLDSSVSGLMVVAKTEKFQSEFNELLSQRKIKKHYRALVERKPPLGMIKHYMAPSEKVPKKLAIDFQLGWLECLLEVLQIVPWKTEGDKEYWDLELELHTGRTHQIRAQLSWSEAPILGDKLYRGRNRLGFTKQKIALHCSKLEWTDSQGLHQFKLEPNF